MHDRKNGMDAIYDTPEIEVDDAVPMLERRCFNLKGAANALLKRKSIRP
jgi:hypothetical protein